MLIYEIIKESKETNTGLKPHKNAEFALPNAHRVAGTADRTYDLNRIMMCVASSDGKNVILTNPESWAGRNNMAFPYTKAEADMLKKVYKHMNMPWEDALKPNPREKSEEEKDVNKVSPVARRRPNQYGV